MIHTLFMMKCVKPDAGKSLVSILFTKQETAKGGMTGLQSGNIIGKDPLRTNINAEVNMK